MDQERERRVLEPGDRISEVLFGLIMVLGFTGSLSVAEAGREDVRAMLVGALGCNLAWGVIDAIMYVMGCLSERAQRIRTWRAVREASDPDLAREALSGSLPPVVAGLIDSQAMEGLQGKLRQLPEPPAHPRLRAADGWGALAVFLLVFLSTLPVVLPFVFMDQARHALRVSNAVAIVLLFFTGWAFGRTLNYRPWVMGFSMVVLGGILVAITIALGG